MTPGLRLLVAETGLVTPVLVEVTNNCRSRSGRMSPSFEGHRVVVVEFPLTEPWCLWVWTLEEGHEGEEVGPLVLAFGSQGCHRAHLLLCQCLLQLRPCLLSFRIFPVHHLLL